MTEPLLTIKDLKVEFQLGKGVLKAVNGVNLTVARGQTVGLVGETGCGKSVTGLSILRLVPRPGRIVGGEVIFDGRDLLKMTGEEIREIRGQRIAMIFQDPSASLDPVYTVGDQIGEPLRAHKGYGKRESLEKARDLLSLVGVPSAAERIRDYPHMFSGGMKQRAMIAMALACQPSLLIADEPTTNLDVTIQAQVLDQLKESKEKFGSSLLLITHDLGIVAEMCDQVAIMYAGQIVEYGDVASIFERPLHPYTVGLLNCLPDRRAPGQRLEFISGAVPDMISPPTGCKFHPRCPRAFDRCPVEEPQLREVEKEHWVACHLY